MMVLLLRFYFVLTLPSTIPIHRDEKRNSIDFEISADKWTASDFKGEWSTNLGRQETYKDTRDSLYATFLALTLYTVTIGNQSEASLLLLLFIPLALLFPRRQNSCICYVYYNLHFCAKVTQFGLHYVYIIIYTCIHTTWPSKDDDDHDDQGIDEDDDDDDDESKCINFKLQIQWINKNKTVSWPVNMGY